MGAAETLRTLEVIASNDPVLLPFILAVLAVGPARPELREIAGRWSVSLADLHVTAARAARDLDRLQRRGVRCGWNPCRVLHCPNLAALADLVAVRRQRLGSVKKLEAIERRIRCAYEDAERRRRVTNFLSEDTGPVSSQFLAEFLPHRTTARAAQRPNG